jgi:nitroreductase
MDIATVDRVLTTTRVVRRRLDLSRPVERDVVERCIDIALQAPTGSNAQGWHFVVVTDRAKRAALADLYRRAAAVVAQMYGDNPYPPGDLRARQFPRMRASGDHFREHLHEGMLALRARGIGCAWTTNHLMYEAEAAELLGLPPHVTQVALLAVAYFTGDDFKPARRLPARERTHWNGWGNRVDPT